MADIALQRADAVRKLRDLMQKSEKATGLDIHGVVDLLGICDDDSPRQPKGRPDRLAKAGFAEVKRTKLGRPFYVATEAGRDAAIELKLIGMTTVIALLCQARFI